MNKKVIWYVVGAIVVVGIIVVVVMTMGKSGTASNQPSSGTATPTSMNDLLASGQSQKCTFMTTSSNGTAAQGTVFVTAGHMRGDFTAESATGSSTVSHMITDGTTAYVWTDSPAQGFQMSFASMSSPSAQQGGAAVNPNDEVNYSCSAWSPDQSEFTLPTNITFNSMSAIMDMDSEANVNAGASSSASMCAMCGEAGSASAQAQCRLAMHC